MDWPSAETQNTWTCSIVSYWSFDRTVIWSVFDVTGWLARVAPAIRSTNRPIRWPSNSSCPHSFYWWLAFYWPPFFFYSNISISNISAQDWPNRTVAAAAPWSPCPWVHRTGNLIIFSSWYKPGFLTLVGKSLTFRGAVFEAQEILKNHRCSDPICDTHLWKVKHELDMARLRIQQLEKSMDRHGIKPPQIKWECVSKFKKNDTMFLLMFMF